MPQAILSPNTTLYQALQRVVSTSPERPALTLGSQTLTYSQLGAEVDCLARVLQRLGVTAGEKIAIILPNCLELVYAFFAPAALGAVFVPINCTYRQKEMLHILADSEASVVIADSKPLGNDVEGILTAIAPALPCLRQVILRRREAEGGNAFLDLGSLQAQAGDATLPSERVAPGDLCALIYTSGTTGVPKAVMQSHASMISAVVQSQGDINKPILRRLWGLVRLTQQYGRRFPRYGLKQRVVLSPAPLHALLGYSSLIYGLLYGYRVVIADRFHPAHVLELIERERVIGLIAAPTMVKALLQSPEFARHDLTSLLSVIISSAPCPPELARQAHQAFGCPAYIAFGATEVGGATLLTSPVDTEIHQTQTVGRSLTGMEAKVVDDQRRPLPAGQVGELAFRLHSNMLGYYKAGELTAQAMDQEGWYYTGDLATIDERGYVRIVGRKKDMIIRGGQNVFPAEIENHLLGQPGIAQVAVVGVPDEIAGERVWAFVVPEPGATLTPEDIWNYCRQDLAAYKVPDQVRIVTELPLTSTGKPQKFLLRAIALEEKQKVAKG